MTTPFDVFGRSYNRTRRISSVKNNNVFVDVGNREGELVRWWNNF
jgi:hypothetical protein